MDKQKLNKFIKTVIQDLEQSDDEDAVKTVEVFRIALAALTDEPAASRVPDGWKLVPINSTQEMINAAYVHEVALFGAGHAAMLSVAPSIEEGEPLLRCAAATDGECSHPQCPQIRDNEPHKTGRHCPIDNWDEDE